MKGKKMKLKSLTLFTLMLIILNPSIPAQFKIKKSVLSNGGTNSLNSGFKLNGTLGELFVQKMQSASNIMQPGFWNSIMKSTDVEDETGLPAEYKLQQNYPNPFNPSTIIRWQLPAGSYVVLKVYDILGKEVTTLVNDYKEAGYYETKLDGYSLASGVYIYRLYSGNFISTKKMLMLK
jgi:hypothetical protein